MIVATFALIITHYPGTMDFQFEYTDVYPNSFQTVQECRYHMRKIGEDLVMGLDDAGIRAKFEFKCE